MAALDAQRGLETASPAALSALSDAALADLETRCKVERERVAVLKSRGQAKRATRGGHEDWSHPSSNPWTTRVWWSC